MLDRQSWDYLIIGAGIIGMTIAKELNDREPNAKILVLEKERAIGMHASGRNSGVLHTGIYYPADTLKARFCKAGADLLFAYAYEQNIPVQKDGKVIVATTEKEEIGLDRLLINAKDNHISAVKVSKDEMKDIEPNACSDFGGIYCKDTAVIDSKQVLEKLLSGLQHRKVEFIFNKKIIKIDESQQEVHTADSIYRYGCLINAAGAYADSVAKLANVGLEYTLIPFKGTYYKLDSSVAHSFRASIYPVPNPDLPFLGVHLTRSVSGDVYIGPTIIPALGRENYHMLQGINPKEGISVFYNLLKLYSKNTQNFRNLVKTAIFHSTKSGVIKSARQLMNELQPSWVKTCSKVGIRPQLLNTKEMRLEMDFVIQKGKNSVHVLNSISPAFTSSFAVAKHIAQEINA